MSPYWFVLTREEVNKTFQWVSAVSFDSIITADTTALAEDSSAAYRSPESFPPVESCLVLEPFGSNWLKRRAVIKLWTQRGKPRVMPANQYLLFATTDSYERSDSASSLSRQTTHNISRSALCFFLQRQRYPITVLLTACFRKLDCWSCDLIVWYIKPWCSFGFESGCFHYLYQ